MPTDDTTPAVPMTSNIAPELREFLEEMRGDTKEIKVALLGNKYQTGLIPRVDKLEVETAAHGKKLLVWGAIMSAAGTVIVFLKDFLPKSGS